MSPGDLRSAERFSSSQCMGFSSQSMDFLCLVIPRLEAEKGFDLWLGNDAREAFHILRHFNFSQKEKKEKMAICVYYIA